MHCAPGSNARTLFCAVALACALFTQLETTVQATIAADLATLQAMPQQWTSNPVFMANGKVSVYTATNPAAGYAASGVLIASNWLLTAGHVITQAAETGRTIQAIRFRMGLVSTNPVEIAVADYWTNYPRGSVSGQDPDIALIRLSQPVTCTAPAVMYFGSLASLSGKHCWSTGVGTRGIAAQGLLAADNQQRASQNTIGDCSPPVWLDADYLFYRFSAPGETGALPFEGMGSPGDSGGAVWIYTNSQWRVAAVMSGVTTDPQYNFGNATYAYPVAAQLEWIYEVMGVTPTLSIQRVDASTVKLEWPSRATSYALQTSPSLDTTNWAAASGVVDDGSYKSVTFVCTNEPVRLFRLVKQPAQQSPPKAACRPSPPPGSWDDLILHEP